MFELLTLLADGKPRSYQNLTALLRIDEDRLLSKINGLRQSGIHLEIVRDKVRLRAQLQRLDPDGLSRALAPYRVFVKPVIDSTNQYLLDNIGRLNKGDLCLAEYQTAGRGRRGRQWLSPFAGQIILSFYWTLEAQKPVDGLSLVIGMAISDALKQAGADDISLKWPNDVLLNGRKLAGILVEIAGVKDGLLNLVVGIGINLSVPKQDDRIDQPWAELIEVLPALDRNRLIIRLVKKLYTDLEAFERQGISAEFRQKWAETDHYFGKEVKVANEKRSISGIERGIDEKGRLQLEADNEAQWLSFTGGEVSLRKKE